MRSFVLALIVLLVVVAIFAQQMLGIDVVRAAAAFSALPFLHQFMIGVMALMMLWLVGTAFWQAQRLAGQDDELKALHKRLDSFRDATLVANEAQQDVEGGVRHLISSDPVESISLLQKRLADAESRTALQAGRNVSADIEVRLEEIRSQQHAVRKQLGEVLEKRRAFEPVFGELTERQWQLERSLAEIEADDAKNSLADRLKQLTDYMKQTRTRMKTLQDSFVTLNQYKDELDLSKATLVPLQAPEGGIAFVIDEAHAVRGQLFEAIDKLEWHGNEPLAVRVDSLAKSRTDVQQRIGRLNECFATLDSVRRDFEDLRERQTHIERSLGEVEVDADGKTLPDRLDALNAFAAQTRGRLRVVQDALVTLNGFRDDLKKSQAELAPLHAPLDGIDAVMGQAHALRDQLVATLDKLESSGGEKLTTRVEALAKHKMEIENRITGAVDCFAKLDTIRTDIGGLFSKLSIAIDKHAS